ncbi:MAG: HD domain-containing protein [Pirellulales bacterium]|nr:HD domain-containing protein [Pirellulales bacterium]
MSAPAQEKTPESASRGFLPISCDTLAPTPALNFDLYIRPDDDGEPILYRERKYPLEEKDIGRLLQQGLHTLYIRSGAHEEYRSYLLDTVIHNERLEPVRRYQILKKVARSAFNSAFRSVNPDHLVEFAEDIGKRMTEVICSKEMVLADLFSLMEHDYYTYTHVTNVCTCCVALASELGVDRETELVAIASGALLHDIGKRHIPPSILNKPGGLSPDERKLVQEHSRTGFEELCLREDLTWGQLMMVYQHHERLDGRGYPAGLQGDAVHPWARICAIADVFDALSTDRPYRKGDSIAEVLVRLEQQAGTSFDTEMVRCFKTMIHSKN